MPSAHWASVLGGAALAWMLCVGYFELRLALRGFSPGVTDSQALWLQQRERAASLGPRALVLVGASRMELDVDTAVLRAATGLEPVQLAIDGSSFVPVLAGLAGDPAVTGTVLVDFAEPYVAGGDPGAAADWETAWERRSARVLPGFDDAEEALTRRWRGSLRSYADGARPLDTLLSRILRRDATPQYLVMRADRSILADYSRLKMPDAYHGRVLRHLGEDIPYMPGATPADLEAELRRRIAALAPRADLGEAFDRGATAVLADARAIEARGGTVRFAMLPRSGLVRDIDERRFPRTLFWDRFIAGASAPGLHYADIAEWNALQCPDGSHLDLRQRAAFTRSLAALLND